MAIVVDCSAIMGLCFEDEVTKFHNKLLDYIRLNQTYVPSIWPAEVSNVLLAAERRKRITPDDAANFIGLLSSLNFQVINDAGLENSTAIMPLARAFNLSYYDAQYLHLARTGGYMLATLDRALATAAKKAGVTVL